jgi:hypothetical protein
MIENKDWCYHKQIENIENIKSEIKFIGDPMNIFDRSTRGENSTQFNLFSHQNKFPKTISIIKEQLKSLFKSSKLTLKSAWTVLGQSHGYHKCHRHSDESTSNHVSTICYLEVPLQKSYDLSGLFYYLLRNTKNEIDYYEVNPKPGTLIVMPTYIYHGAYPQSPGLRQTLNLDFEYEI